MGNPPAGKATEAQPSMLWHLAILVMAIKIVITASEKLRATARKATCALQSLASKLDSASHKAAPYILQVKHSHTNRP